MIKQLISLAPVILKYLPGKTLALAVAPSLSGVFAAFVTLFQSLAKLVAAFIEGVVDLMNHPKLTPVVAAAFVFGLIYSHDGHKKEIADIRAQHQQCDCGTSTAKKKTPAKVPKSEPFKLDRWLPF